MTNTNYINYEEIEDIKNYFKIWNYADKRTTLKNYQENEAEVLFRNEDQEMFMKLSHQQSQEDQETLTKQTYVDREFFVKVIKSLQATKVSKEVRK